METHATKPGRVGPTEYQGLAPSTPPPPVVPTAHASPTRRGASAFDSDAFEGLSIPSVVTHELRAPLQALSISAGLLADTHTAAGARQVRKLASLIVRQSLWLQATVENLLCAAAIQDGRLGLHVQTFDLQDVLASVTPVVRPLLQQKSQSLHLKVDHALPPLEGDRQRIAQALVNLLVNASKYSPCGTRINLMASATTHGALDWVKITFADRGPGLPPEGAAALFAPFQRGALTADAAEGGAGLGLAIVRAVIHAHGGQVGAEPRLGGGSCFWITLPTATQLPSSWEPPRLEHVPGRKRRTAC